MHLIQPCCAKKDLRELRDSIARGGTKQFEGYGDLSLTELLPALLLRYDGVEMMIVAPSLPDQAAEIIDWWMNKQWPSKNGKEKIDVIHRLTIAARLEKDKSDHIFRWLKEKPFGERLTLVDKEQEDTAILLPDFAITGPVNMRYGHHFVATATTETEKVIALWEKYKDVAAGHQADGVSEPMNNIRKKTVTKPRKRRQKK